MKDRSIQLVLEAFKTTGYLVVNKTLISRLGVLEAIVLSNYIDKYIYFQQKQTNFNGWFYLTHENITKQLNLKEPTIARIKKELIDLGILSTVKKGVPAREWIQINFESLMEYVLTEIKENSELHPHESTVVVPHEGGGLLRRTKLRRTKTKDIVGGQASNRVMPSKEKRNEKFLPLAQYLHEIISTSKKIKYNANQIKSWADEIRKLSEMHTIDPVRIKRALRWYKSNVGGQYIPVIESGYSLRMKFIALEAAKERQDNPWEDKKKEEQPSTTGWMSNKFTDQMSPEELQEHLRGGKKK